MCITNNVTVDQRGAIEQKKNNFDTVEEETSSRQHPSVPFANREFTDSHGGGKKQREKDRKDR